MRIEGDEVRIELGGGWRLRQPQPAVPLPDPAATRTEGAQPVRRVIVTGDGLGEWDSALVLFLARLRQQARAAQLELELRSVPPAARAWLERLDQTTVQPTTSASPPVPRRPLLQQLAAVVRAGGVPATVMLEFFGDCVLALAHALVRPWRLRWHDCLVQMRRSAADALPVVGLITLLVGVILSFVGAVQLRSFGADIFVADLVGLAMFREMGPMMTAVVLTGRTGAAYAAELGNMRLNEEIDALETFGVRPLDFLITPRLFALVLLMPLLALYADFLGVAGGMIVSHLVLGITPEAFFQQMQTAVGLNDVGTGVLKSFFFGLLVAYAGCLKGMNATRSAMGVGNATTAAVVLGILLVIVADAIFTVVFNSIGW